MPVPKPPTVYELWPYLSQEQKDKVTGMFLDWLYKAANQVNSKHDAEVLASLLKYHELDLTVVIENAIKPEYRKAVDLVKKVFTG